MALNLENILKQVGKNTEWQQPLVKEAKKGGLTSAQKVLAALGIGGATVGTGVVIDKVFNTPTAPASSTTSNEATQEVNTEEKNEGKEHKIVEEYTNDQQAKIDSLNTPKLEDAIEKIEVTDDGSGTQTSTSQDSTITQTNQTPPSNSNDTHINTQLKDYYQQVEANQDTTAVGKEKRKTDIEQLNELLKLNAYNGASKAELLLMKHAGIGEVAGTIAGHGKNMLQNVGRKIKTEAKDFKESFKKTDAKNEGPEADPHYWDKKKKQPSPEAQQMQPAPNTQTDAPNTQTDAPPQAQPSQPAPGVGNKPSWLGNMLGKKRAGTKPTPPAPSMGQPKDTAKSMSKAGSVMAKLANKDLKYTYKGNPYKHEPGDPRFDEIMSSMNLDPKLYQSAIADTTKFKDNVGTGAEMTHWALPKDLSKFDPVLQRKQEANYVGDQSLETMGNYVQWLKDNKRPVSSGKK